jgi:outer membrane protein assembly factor BamB/subtilisin family serine protease
MSLMTAVRVGLFLLLLGVGSSLHLSASIIDASDLPTPPLSAEEDAQGYRFGRVLTKVREPAMADGGGRRHRELTEERKGIRARRTFSRLRGQEVLEFDATRPVAEVIRELQATGLYEFVEPDRVIRPLVIPNDPGFSGNTGWNLRVIDAPAAWDVRTDASAVLVAVIDSGARLNHEDLRSNLWVNPSPSSINDIHGINTLVASGTGRGNPSDDSGHGSHVSGIIGSVGNNGRGTAGLAWQVRMMQLKFLPAEGNGSTANAIACINYAIEKGAQIINASYGSDTSSQSELAAIRAARNVGIIFVAAAGNDGKDSDGGRHFPSTYALDNIVSVAATNSSDNLAAFSNFGSGAVELGAPGENIYSTLHTSDSAYGFRSGTSMAAPHVTGALALLRAQFPQDNYRQLINRLLRSVDPITALNGRTQTGGRLNVQRALTSTSNRPFNDDFAARARLSGANVRVRSSNTGGTRESGEPAHAGFDGGSSLWWQWTAVTNGLVTFDTVGSEYDTLLAIYTGSDVNGLSLVASNDNSPTGGTTSRISLTVSSGTTYVIAVDGKNGAAGFTSLRIGSVPPNDNLANATVVSGETFRVDSYNRNASKQSGEPNHAGVTGGRSVWYRWTAPSSGQFQLAAFSTDMDTVAAVYTGTSFPLTLVAANDDLISSPYRNTDALVTFNATAGTSYLFAVDDADSTSGDGGNFNLTLNPSLWQAATQDEMTGTPAVGGDGSVYVGSTDGHLYAFSSSGSYRWRNKVGKIGDSAPAIGTDGTIYVGSTDGKLHAVSSNGNLRWTATVGSTAYGSTPAIAEDGTIYFRDDTTLYAYTSGGGRKWSRTLSGVTYSSPVVATDGTVYVGAVGRFYAFTPDGNQKWTLNTNGDIFSSPAIGSDGSIYFATLSSANQSGRVYAVTPAGAVRWNISVGSGREISSSPVLGPDGTLYFASYDEHLYAVSSSGSVRWSYRMGDETRASSPAVDSAGRVYIGSYDGSVHVVTTGGALVRKLPTAGRIRSSMTLANGRLYFSSQDAKLYAFAAGQPADSPWPQFQRVAENHGRAGATTGPLEEPPPPGPGGGDAGARVINLSTLAHVGSAEAVLVGGFVLRDGPRRLLIRGVGPTLAQFGVNAPLADPVLTLHRLSGSDNVIIKTNDDWSNDAEILAAAQNLAFPLPENSKDAAMVVDLEPGNYTATVTSAGPGSGPAIVEMYELGGGSGRFINLATRTRITGSQTATAGFVLREGRQEVLVRVAGPSLSNFGISGPAADPRLELNRGQTKIAENDDWLSTAAHSSAFAFPAGSKDAALRVVLEPGEYTVVARSGTTAGGIVLIEVYVIDP